MNPILSMLNSQRNPKPAQALNVQVPRSGNFLSDFAAFKRSMEGKDPKAMVDELRASGRMSEQQYQSLLSKAQDIATLFK